MSGFLLDTNVISELLRPLPDERVAAWCKAAPKAQLHVSVVSFGEIRKGLTIMLAGARSYQLEEAFQALIPHWFEYRILPVSKSVAERWGLFEGQRQLMGRPLHVADAQIAATAWEHSLILVTRNVRDFEELGMSILNPWG